ncbi:hypothetical protein PSH79_16275 [Pseudomonas sp. FP2196]|uniref:hypothetical protein n=1 Tax=Pseudomonas sp. FP2196 TaxID=2954086 RepID=UPI0027358EC4|nr:hypothetical protein [Pseudomonas sp. FP2196]WLH33488.1 hypothetical protein PSH79_16275 [Pseudomonas sp. FP2196]
MESKNSDRMKSDKCYYCLEPKKGVEHVPPKCFFPQEGKKNYRNNLITVPSCDVHNSNKSTDDQYMFLLFNVISNFNDDPTARKWLVDKGVATILRRSHILTTLTDDLRIMDGKLVYRNASKEVVLKPDYSRIGGFFSAMARAIFFKENSESWGGGVFVIPLFLVRVMLNNTVSFNKLLLDISRYNSSKGQNKDVFSYTFSSGEGFDGKLLHMFFYGEFEAVCFFLPDAAREGVLSKFKDVPGALWV